MMRKGLRLLIFDLGGVIINLFPDRTLTAFAELSGLSIDEIEKLYQNNTLFKQYEVGAVSDQDFRTSLAQLLKLDSVENILIDQAWNAMLGDIPAERIEEIINLKKEFRSVVLSNTNSIHEKAFHQKLQSQHQYKHLNKLFDAVYLSHEVKARKPTEEIFKKVIAEEGIDYQEALFMDDTPEHLQSAERLGIQCLHIPRNLGFYNSLQSYLSE